MSVMTQVCAWITRNPGRQFRTRDIVAMTGIQTDQVSNALRGLADTGALQIVEANHGRGGNIYAVVEAETIRLRSFGAAPPPVVELPAEPEVVEPEESPYLTYAVDHDGDLQILQPDGAAFTIDNANARRLVAFVATQATAILTAGRA